MPAILGIDIGTSSTKVMLLDPQTGEQWVQAQAYDVSTPRIGYAEQDPDLWWQAVLSCLARLREQKGELYRQIACIGLSGQMHGLVMTDAAGVPVRPAILWNDQRSGEECEFLREQLSEKQQREVLRNRIFPGFALPSLLWVRRHEPEVFARARWVMQPKDYVRSRLTGCVGAEVSDASATLMFDIEKRDWAWEVLEECGFPRKFFPRCHESGEIQGTVSKECAALTGLPEQVKVLFGMGDQQAQSIGSGVFREGTFICNIGTGGQISSFSQKPVSDRQLRTQTFCHGLPGAYTVYGAVLNAGMSLKWLKDQILQETDFRQMSRMAGQVPPGSEGLIFLPYLTGERTPHMNPDARGIFFGLHLTHTRDHMARAVMEGVTFALRESMEILEELGLPCDRILSSGGGASSPVWLQIQADIFGKEVQVCRVKEQACLGACMLAGTAAGIYPDVGEAARQLAVPAPKIYRPGEAAAEAYRKQYEKYREIYRQVKDLF